MTSSRRRLLEIKCALEIQRIYRGHRSRKRVRAVRNKLSREEAAVIIQVRLCTCLLGLYALLHLWLLLDLYSALC